MDLLNLQIETERLLLIPISMKFKNVIFQEFTEEITIFMHLKAPENIEEAEKLISESIAGLQSNTNLQIVILDKKTKEFLGCGGIHRLNKIPEMGCWIKKSAQGNGFGKETITGLKNWADQNLNYKYILYDVDERNHASKKIPESLGGRIARRYKQKNLSGKDLHLIEYRIHKRSVEIS